jgi:hypothetical protein
MKKVTLDITGMQCARPFTKSTGGKGSVVSCCGSILLSEMI